MPRPKFSHPKYPRTLGSPFVPISGAISFGEESSKAIPTQSQVRTAWKARSSGERAGAILLVLYPAFWAARQWGGGQPWPLAAVLYLPGIVFLVGPLFLAVWAVLTRQVAIGWMALVLLVATVGPLMEFRWGGGSDEVAALRIATINAGSWRSDLDGLAEGLAELDADVILLQEVWAQEHLERIQRALPGYRFVSGEPPETRGAKHYRLSLFVATRLPVSEQASYPEACVQMVTVQGKGRQLVIANLHGLKQFGFRPVDLKTTVAEQQGQGEAILDLLKSHAGPVLVGGDFNAPPEGPLAKGLLSGRTEAFEAVGLGYGYSYPARFPVWKIDHLMSSSALQPLRAWTVDVGSDHRALVADYRWAP